MTAERRRVKDGVILVYTIGRTNLLDKYLREMQNETVRIFMDQKACRAYEQLWRSKLNRQSGMIL